MRSPQSDMSTHHTPTTQVEAVHAAVVQAMRDVYYRHRTAYGWGDRELVIV